MAYTTINKPSDYFNIKTYTGNGSSQTLDMDNVGLLWMKNRTEASNHILFDSVKGGYYTSSPGPELRANTDIAGSGSDITSTYGITFGSSSSTIGSDGGGYNYNQSGKSYVGWQWRANGAGSSNTAGSTTSTVSVNTTSGFSIVKYTGTSAVATIGHGLGVIPKMIIVKNLSSGSRAWRVWHQNLTSASKYLILSSSATEGNDSATWNNTLPTNAVFSSAGSGEVNQSGNDFIAYCFAEKKGYSKCGQYIGTGTTTGNFIYTGFRPKYILSKKITGSGSWNIVDADRLGYNRSNERMYANNTSGDGGDTVCDIYSNGFSWYDDGGDMNTNDDRYMYYAVAESPLVGTNNVPANAR